MCNPRAALLLGLLWMAFCTFPPVAHAEVDLADLYAKTSPSVVTLTTYSATGEKTGQGSGFVVDKTGVVVTCLHVVVNAAIVEMELADGST